MLSRCLLLLGVLGLVAMPAPAPAAGESTTTPALVVRLRSIDGLVSDLKYIATLAGQGDQAGQAEMIVKSQMGENGLMGIDPKRPIGMYGIVSPNVAESSAVVLVPIASEKTLLDFMKNFSIEPKKGSDDIYTVNHPAVPVPVYIRFANKYAYITAKEKAALSKDQLLAPATILPPESAETFYASFRVDQVPDALKQIAVGQLELRLAEAQEAKQPGETEIQRTFRKEIIKYAGQLLSSVLTEGGALTFSFNVDHKASSVAYELSFNGQPNSKLAKTITDLGKSRSSFSGLRGSDSAFSGHIHAAVPQETRNAFYSVITEGFGKAIAKQKDENARKHAEALIKAFTPSLKAGELDVAFDLRGPSSSDKFTLVAGIKLKDAQEIEKVLRELAQQIPASERERVQLDAETVGNVKIHKLDVASHFDPEAKKTFGDSPAYLAIGPNGAFLTLGPDGLSAVKQAVTLKPKAGPAMEMEMSLGRFVPLMKDQKGDPKAIADRVFTGENKGKDKFKMTLEGGTGLRLRVEMQGALLAFFTQLGQAQK